MTRKMLFLAMVAMLGAPSLGHAAFSFNGTSGAPSDGEFIAIKLINFEAVLDGDLLAAAGYAFSPSVAPTGAQIKASAQIGGLIDDVGDQLYGIAQLTSIEGQGLNAGNQYWVPTATQELVAEFWGYTAANVPGAIVGGNVSFVLGAIRIWFDGTPDFTGATGPFTPAWVNAAISNGVGNIGDTVFLEATAIGGILASPPVANEAVTLNATFTGFTATRFTGVGDGFLDVTFSSDIKFNTDALDGDTNTPPYTGEQDLSLKNNFDSRPPGTPAGSAVDPRTDLEEFIGWSVQSQDPIIGQVQIIPEPGSLTMFAVLGGLAVLAGVRRRRRASNQ